MAKKIVKPTRKEIVEAYKALTEGVVLAGAVIKEADGRCQVEGCFVGLLAKASRACTFGLTVEGSNKCLMNAERAVR